MSKRLGIAIALLVLFSTYKPQELFLIRKFSIKEIKIENNFILKEKNIKKNLIFLYDSNNLGKSTSPTNVPFFSFLPPI